jgi:hypothetical protein
MDNGSGGRGESVNEERREREGQQQQEEGELDVTYVPEEKRREEGPRPGWYAIGCLVQGVGVDALRLVGGAQLVRCGESGQQGGVFLLLLLMLVIVPCLGQVLSE